MCTQCATMIFFVHPLTKKPSAYGALTELRFPRMGHEVNAPIAADLRQIHSFSPITFCCFFSITRCSVEVSGEDH